MLKNFAVNLVVFFCVCLSTQLYAQGSLRGKVIDSKYGETMLFANVALYKNNVLVTGTETDIDGNFLFSDIDPGNYDIVASSVGYIAKNIKIQIESNVEVYLSIEIIAQEDTGSFVIINAPYHSSSFSPKSISINGRYASLAGSFDDPSRSLIRFPGFANGNDQANSIIYHGLPADMIKWTIDGAEIVNPNHLANAGTFSDQASASSGGVLAISQEMIEKFDFFAAPYEANQNNALAGIANIQPIDNRNQTAFLKLGLLGIEGAYSDSKVAAHYRYSTVGLLSKAGLDFGNEEIVFQDLFTKFTLLDNDKNKLSLTSILGRSSNDKSAIDTLANAATYKDLQEIHYMSDIAIVGLSHTGKYENNLESKSALYYSNNNNERSELTLNEPDTLIVNRNLHKFSYAGNVIKTFHQNKSVTGGLNMTYNMQDNESNLLVNPNVSYKLITDHWTLKGTLGCQWLDGYSINEIDVLGSLEAEFSFNNGEIGFVGSKTNQRYMFRNQLTDFLMNSVASSIYLNYRTHNDYRFFLRGFYQQLFDLPSDGTYTAIDGSDAIPLDFQGRARTYGIDIKADKEFRNFTYLTLSASLFQVEKEVGRGLGYKPGAYNYGYIINGALSKYFSNQRLNIHLGLTYRGGEQTYLNGTPPLFEPTLNYGEKLAAYFRADLRLKCSFGKNQRNQLTLDIQNLTNRQNDAYYFYDQLTENIELQRQLGIIPILSWKYTLL